jgi:hypothetical protein
VPPHKVPGWVENIEEFMTSIESGLEEIKTLTKDRKLSSEEFKRAISYAQVFTNMMFIFASVLNEAQNGPSLSLYRPLLETCGPNDVFATFNWDTLLDRALMDSGGWNPNEGYGLGFRAVFDGTWKPAMEGKPQFETAWKLLKLHGSTNWLVPHMGVHFETLEYQSSVPKSNEAFLYWHSSMPYATHRNRWTGGYVPTTYCYYPPHIPGEFFTKAQLSPGPGHVFLSANLRVFSPFEEGSPNGVPSSPILITPVRQKRYDGFAQNIENLWMRAVEALENAHRIVIVGYSFPATDVRPLDLFRSVLAARGEELSVEIVAPGVEEIANRIGRDILGRVRELKLHSMKFEEYMDSLYSSTAAMMRSAAASDKEVRDWLAMIHAMYARHERDGVLPQGDIATSGRP